MMKRLNVMLSIFMLVVMSNLSAQENLDFSGKQGMVSPEVNGHSVTFRFFAPHAKSVRLQGSWIPMDGNYQIPPVGLIKGEDGVWTYTRTFDSDLYTYNFLVDGIRVNDPNNVYSVRDVASVMSMLLVGDGKADLYKVNDVPHGTVARCWYPSKGLDMARRISIYTPPGYESSKEKYPVLYLLHGVGGDEEAWLTLGRAAQILDNLIAQGKARPMVVVFPNGHTSNSAAPGESSKGFYKPVMFTPDVFNGDFEAYFKEIVGFTEQNYRVKADKAHRAIAGLSMGGFHSLMISAKYPELFDYVGLFSPAIRPEERTKPQYQDLFQNLKKQQKAGYRRYWIAIGKDDFLYKDVSGFRSEIAAFNFKYDYKESRGGHTWTNWRDYLAEFAPLLFN